VLAVLLEVSLPLAELLLEVVGHIIVDILEKLRDGGLLGHFSDVKGVKDGSAGLSLGSSLLLLVPETLLLEKVTDADEGVVVGLPLSDLVSITITSRVIGGRVVAGTVRVGLNEARLLLAHDVLTGSSSSLMNSEEIVTIDADGVDAVAESASSDTVTAVLILGGGRDGVTVVTAEEHDRSLKGSGEVQTGVEITFGGSTLTEEANNDLVRLGLLKSISGTNSLRELSGEGGGDSLEVEVLGTVVDRHLTTLTKVILVTEALVSELLEGEATPHEDTSFTVLSIDDIFLIESGRATDVSGLLTEGSHVERDTTLTLGIIEDLVHVVQLDHVLVHLHKLSICVFNLIVLLNDITIVISDAIDRNELTRGGDVELVCVGSGRAREGKLSACRKLCKIR